MTSGDELNIEPNSNELGTSHENLQRPPDELILKDLYQGLERSLQRRLSEERFRIAREHNVDEDDLDAQIEWSYEVESGFRDPDEDFKRWKPYVEEYFRNTRHLSEALDTFLEERTNVDLGRRSILAIRYLLGDSVKSEELISDSEYNSTRVLLSGEESIDDENIQSEPDDESYEKAKQLIGRYLIEEVVSGLSDGDVGKLKELALKTIEKYRRDGAFEVADEWALDFMNISVLSGDEQELALLDEKYPKV